MFEACRARSKRRVLTAKARDLVPRYRPPRRLATLRAREAVIAEYMTWAATRGLESVAIYEDADYARLFATAKHGLAVREVPVADFLGAAPEPEPWE